MKAMKHILPRLALLSVAALLAVSCHKSTGEGANVALKRQFDAWRAIHYPAAVEKDGIYILEDTPGNGPAWNKNLGITFMTYTMRDLDGDVAYNTDEQWAKQLGKWNQTYYYGPQVVPTGKDATYAGLDILLDGMREGGVRTAIIPSWMMTYNRYDSLDKYLETSTDTPSMIYTVTFLGQTDNLKEYEYRLMKEYASENGTWPTPSAPPRSSSSPSRILTKSPSKCPTTPPSISITPDGASPTARCSTPPWRTPPSSTTSTARPRPTRPS